jgi:hypothetical protein
MSRLFAEAFIVPVAEPDGEPPRYAYDERRDVNVLDDGRPVVEAAAVGETYTLTEVRAEREDRDADDRAALDMETLTKVAREGSDRDATELLLGTETRQVPGEREDFLRDLDGGTHTAVRAEAEDFARDGIDIRDATGASAVNDAPPARAAW